jgi:hypothetical protein
VTGISRHCGSSSFEISDAFGDFGTIIPRILAVVKKGYHPHAWEFFPDIQFKNHGFLRKHKTYSFLLP